MLQVLLKKETSLERARTAQRNFIADYLKNNTQGRRDAALVAFVSPAEEDWRFSLVKLEHSLEIKEKGLKVVEELTPAKRWSFLVGKNEGSHTAQSRFVSLLKSDDAPNLAEFEEAFNIEKVTNEFFEKYCELFLRMKESLDALLEKDSQLKKDFESKEISTVDFAKKTLGQMAFLYFLQKKGWFGVKASESWGAGTKIFLRELFSRREKYGKNFFDDVLEPLFYEALAVDRGKEAIYTRLNNCRMPFLNGGLFEPMNGYAWETTHIFLPDELFSNTTKDKKTGDIGDGILDIFDRYNFTVNENEPLEKEVAVDPEMLGKVFENLLEIKDRKSKGAFYTPREIVHYMCQESLINYLHSETNEEILREDIKTFLKKGAQIIQNDKTVLEKGKETETYKFILPESIRTQAEKLDKLLANIKVCDPAVGSGAFPLGMLNEIVQARQVLGVHLDSNASTYDLKLHSISHSIYGVDIDSGAVEIAKLRLWLALVVEEEEPHPLPNLEHKIMQGNSLISEYEGIKLFDESIFEKEKKKELKQMQLGIGKTSSELKMESLRHKTEDFIHESQRSKKETLKEQIDHLKWEIIEASMEEQGRSDKLEEIRKLRKKNIKPFFIWKLEFSDIFKEKGGFDVVIANPPYLGEKGNKDIFRPIAKGNLDQFYQGKMDLFYFFFHLALDLGRNNTQNAFITTNYYITASGGKNLREDLKNRSTIRNMINFNELRIFESARGQHNMITIFSKGQDKNLNIKTCITQRIGDANEQILNAIVSGNDEETDYSLLGQNSLYDGEESYIRLGGAGNIDSPIEKILEKIKKQGDIMSSIFDITCGCDITISKITNKHLKDFNDSFVKGEGVFVLSKKELSELSLNDEERALIKSYLKNSNIYQYTITPASDYLIYLKWESDIEKYPNIKKHLLRFKTILDDQKIRYNELTWPWYSIHRPREERIFNSNEKIVVPYRAKRNIFGYTLSSIYSSRDVFFITLKPNSDIQLKYALALLNSKLYFLWLYNKGKRKGEMLELYQKPLSEIPIKKISSENQKPFIDIVDQILAITSAPDYDPKKPPIQQKELEAKIDEMVFDLYDLTAEERKIVLNS